MGKISVNDDDLYEHFRNGELTAYDELIRRYSDGLTRYLNGVLHNLSDAEDMMVESFSWILLKKPRIQEGGFKSYLFQVGRHYAIRLKKKSRNHDVFSLEELEAEPVADVSVDQTAILNDRKQILKLCLDRLEPDMREAMYLVYFDGLAYAQAADVMDVSYKKIDNLLSRGKKQLRAELEKEGVTDPFV